MQTLPPKDEMNTMCCSTSPSGAQWGLHYLQERDGKMVRAHHLFLIIVQPEYYLLKMYSE